MQSKLWNGMNHYVPKLGVRGSSPLGIANLFLFYNVVATGSCSFHFEQRSEPDGARFKQQTNLSATSFRVRLAS